MSEAELKRSRRACRELTRRTARNFYYSFRVLPRPKHRDMCSLYAFMRRTDDIADADRPAAERRAGLDEWWGRTAAALDGGDVDDPLLPAVAEMVGRVGIDPDLLAAVVAGCRQDTEPVAVRTRSELEEYCYRVAGAVGLCCVRVWGFDESRAAEVERLSIQTGFAFQLTNILRDLKEDAANGRLYLPREDLRGVTVADLAAQSGPPSGTMRDVVVGHAVAAGEAYRESAALLPLLSRDGRRVLAAMRSIYGGLLAEIGRRDHDVFSGRVRLSAGRKLLAAWRASRLP